MDAASQGFVNEPYPPSDVGRWIAEIDAEGDPDGDGGFGLLPQDGPTVIGINQLLFHKGYMIAPLARNAAARGTGTRRGAMASFDISNLSNIKRSFFRQDDLTNEIREAHGLVLSSGDILCINTITGVQFWNVSDPTDIRLISDLRIPEMSSATYGKTGWWVMGQHPYYYLGSTQRGLHIIKATDPANPVLVKRLSGSELGIPSVGSVHCIGNLMVLGSAGQSESATGPFSTLDISDPENPKLLDLASGSGNYSVGVYGNYITTHGGGGLTVWDMSDPTNLQPVYSNTSMNVALYSCFADKHFHIPNFWTYEKFDFPIPGPPLLVSSGIAPIRKVHEFAEKLGNLIVATGGGEGDGVKFLPHQAAPDTQAPEVNFVNPANLAVNCKVSGRIGVVVTDTLDFTTVNSATFGVREVGGGQLDGKFSYSRNYLNFIPSAPLKENTTYELVIPTGGIKDIVGNGILPFTSRFATGPEVLTSMEPGLVINAPANGGGVTGSFVLAFSVTNFALGSGGRSLASFIDGIERGIATSASPISISALAPGPHTIRIELRQDGVATGLTASTTFTVNPPSPNQTPRITLVAPTSALPESTVTLDATQSSDPDNGPSPLTFRWELLGGPTAALASATSPATTVRLAGTGDYDFRLTLGDGALTATRDFRITVRNTPREVLMVTPTGGFAGPDVNLRDHLVARGLIVSGITPQTVTKAIAENYGLVLVSSSISSPTLNLGLTGALVPVMVCESYVFDDFGMTGRVENVDFGNLSLNKAVMGNPANALTAGLPGGETTVFTKLSPGAWGRPGPDAMIGAATASGQALVFGYDQGVAMVAGYAPARRLGMLLGENSFPLLTPSGLALFNTGLDWALGTSTPAPVTQPALIITSPAIDTTLTGSFSLTFTVTNFALGSDGRSLAWFVDGIERGTATSALPISISGLAPGTHTIRIDLRQNGVATGMSASTTFTVNPPSLNQPARITLVAPTTALPGSTVTLDASQSSDPDNGPSPLTFRWELLGGPSATLASATSPATTVRLAAAGDYDFRLNLSDGNLTANRDFRITVRETPGEVLMVTASGSFAGADLNLRNHLVTRGMTVVGIKASLVTRAVAEGYGLVLVSGTISSPTLNLGLKDAMVPVMVCESYVFDDLGMTARVENVDFGNLSLNKGVIGNPANALTAGLPAGENALFSKLSPLPWGRPGPNAIIGAATASGQALVFGYDQRVAMVTGSAPGRRVGMMMGENSFLLLTPAGLALFNNALDWVTRQGMHSGVELEISDSLSFGPLVTSQTPVILQAATVGGTGQIEYSWEVIGADGLSSQTVWSASNLLSRAFSAAGNYTLILRVRDAKVVKSKILRLVVHAPLSASVASSSSGFALAISGTKTVWNVNPDNNSVTVLNAATLAVIAEIPVAADPRTLSVMGNAEVWVASHDTPAVTVISQASRAVLATIVLPRGSALEGMIIAPDRNHAYVALRGAGGIAKINVATRQLGSILNVLPTPKGLAIDPAGARLFVTHFISPDEAGKVTEVNLAAFAVSRVIDLGISTRPDSISSGRGLPNYLSHPGITPDGASLLIPSKQDNILLGITRDGNPLSPENTVRAIVSKVDLSSGVEVHEARWDINDSDSPNAVAFSPLGNLVFVSLQGSNAIAVLDAYNRKEVTRFEVEAAPDALLVDRDSGVLYVHHFLDRSVAAYSVVDLSLLRAEAPLLLGRQRVLANEKLDQQVLLGKKIFYNASDPRMSSNGYISCASCHLDGDGDGRVWDFTDRGEGLRNTIDLRGRSGTGHGRIHWSGNFDEVQDFENDIRLHFGGLGFLSQSAFDETSASLGEPKAGRSAELDALAAYVSSLHSVPTSPYRNSDGSLTTGAARGRGIFERLNCASCHTGEEFTDSARMVLHDVGTLKPGSGSRMGAALTGIDTPTLKGLWASAPYFHDGSAKTLRSVIDASGPLHGNMVALNDAEKSDMIAYLYQLEQSDSNQPVGVSQSLVNGSLANAQLPAEFATDGAMMTGDTLVENLSSGVLPARDGEVGSFEVQVRIRKGLNIGSTVQTSPDCRVWKAETAQRVMLDDSAPAYDVVGFRVPLAGRRVLFVRIPIGE